MDGQTTYEPVLLTENQAVLYFCLTNIAGAVTSLSRIAGETGISEHTLKSCLKKLTKERLITTAAGVTVGGELDLPQRRSPETWSYEGTKHVLQRSCTK